MFRNLIRVVLALVLSCSPASAQDTLMGGAGGYGSGCSYSAEACAYFARMTVQPDATRKGLLDTLLVSWKTVNVFTACDFIHIYALPLEQQGDQNVISSSFTAVPTAFLPVVTPTAPIFVADQGYHNTSSISGGYLNSSYNPTVVLGQFQRNSGAVIVYVRNDVNDSLQNDFGQVTGTFQTGLNSRSTTSNALRARVNQASTAGPTTGNTTSLGMFAYSRPDSATVRTFYNNFNDGTASVSSVAVVSGNLVSMASPTNLPANVSAREISLDAVCSGLTYSQLSTFYTAFQTYMTAIGKNVAIDDEHWKRLARNDNWTLGAAA